MHILTRLLLTLLVTVLATLRSSAQEPEPFLKRGRYVGTITVVEKIPLADANGIDSSSPFYDRFVVSTKAAGRVVATVGRGIRVLGTPGTHLLGYLDEPNFAAIKVNHPLAGEAVDIVLGNARKGPVSVQVKGARIEIRHDNFFYKRQDFVNGDQDMLGILSVRIDLTRTGR